MRKKKFVYALLTAVFVVSIVGCSTETAKESTSDEIKKKTEVDHAHWSYTGDTGPAHWGELDPANAPCVNGKEQSPINIENTKIVTDQEPEKLEIKYAPTKIAVVNNGHTIQGNVKTNESAIVIDGKEYKLAQFHFHKPSEHQVDGKNFAMELHLVHKDAKGQLAVIGVMIKEGAENSILSKAWENLPKEETKKETELAEQVDLMKLLPTDQHTFRYHGSLTTPPCTEGVKWIVFEEPIEMSKAQIEAFGKIFPDNHRPVLPINERQVIKNEVKNG